MEDRAELEVDPDHEIEEEEYQRYKQLNDLEKECLGLDVDILHKEDINFQVIAKNK